MARAHTVEAIEALVAALKRPKEAVPAAVALLNRGWGLPTQPVVDETEREPLTLLHLIAARRVGELLEARFAEAKAAATNGSATTLERQVIDWSVPALE